MNTLVAKEIRQLRPAFVAALLLAAVPAWLYPAEWSSLYRVEAVWGLAAPLFCIGWLLLALTCFGREFGMGTFPVLLALPVTRQRIWWTKIAVLLCAMAIVLAVGSVSAGLWFNARSGHLSWPLPADNHFVQPIVAVIQQIAAVILAFVVIFASGLWTTLFLRQTLAAFWLAMVVPLALLMLASWGGENILVGEVVLGIYAVAGFFLAQRLFYRAQEVGWTGGEVNLPGWRAAGAVKTATSRAYRPLTALIGKELQLYKIPLAGVAALFVLHLGAIPLRRSLMRSDQESPLAAALSMFGGLWFLIPLVTAGISVSEERRMGTLEAQLCQPLSQRLQFWIKLILALLFSGLLCGSLLWLAEYLGVALHAGTSFLVGKTLDEMQSWQHVTLVFLVISFVVFFASTLARNLLQAIAIAVLMGLGIFLWLSVNREAWRGNLTFLSGPLLKLILLPSLLAVAVWLAYTNFRRLTEARRAWLRIIRALAATFLIALAAATLIYFRTWEYLTPLEPAHSPAKLSLASPPRLVLDWSMISVFMSDGRLWSRRIGIQGPKEIHPFGPELPISFGDGRWISAVVNELDEGSNWVALARDYQERVAIRSDGSLWLSQKPQNAFLEEGGRLVPQKPAPLVRFGEAAGWKDVAGVGESMMMLLKRDGTLWLWGAKYSKSFPGLATLQPVRAGADSDWARFLPTSVGIFLWKKDGTAWRLTYSQQNTNEALIAIASDLWVRPQPAFDNVKLCGFAASQWHWLAVREDGTLWSWDWDSGRKLGDYLPPGVLPGRQVGRGADWVSVAGDFNQFVVLKRDGTLWQWKLDNDSSPLVSPFRNPPEPLGTHNDWVALGGARLPCALAADGSLWFWNAWSGNSFWLTPRWKPVELDNIFSQ